MHKWQSIYSFIFKYKTVYCKQYGGEGSSANVLLCLNSKFVLLQMCSPDQRLYCHVYLDRNLCFQIHHFSHSIHSVWCNMEALKRLNRSKQEPDTMLAILCQCCYDIV